MIKYDMTLFNFNRNDVGFIYLKPFYFTLGLLLDYRLPLPLY